MGKALWTPSTSRIESSQIHQFQTMVEKNVGLQFNSYQELHRWSIDLPESFWEAVWQFSNIQSSVPYRKVLENGGQFPGAKWFPGSRLNFAENLLRFDGDKLALVCLLENGRRQTLSYSDLFNKVEMLDASLTLEFREGLRSRIR